MSDKMSEDVFNLTLQGTSEELMDIAEAAARNCTLRLEHIEALNISTNWTLLQRLYNMCEHTWDPNKTWGVYYWEELIPPLIVYSLTLLLGVSGNTMILWAVLGFREMKSPTNIFLASLAFADLLLCVICLPVKLAELFSFSWTFGHFMCKFVNYMQNVLAVASVLNLTVMSLERCYAIVYPMKAKSVCTVRKAKVVLAFVWMGSFILAAPTIFIQDHKEVGLVEKVFWCVPMESPVLAWQGHEVYFLLIILIIPGGVMSAAYGAIAVKICQCIRERHQLLGSSTGDLNIEVKPSSDEFPDVKLLRRVKTEQPVHRNRNSDVKGDENVNVNVNDVVRHSQNLRFSSLNIKRPTPTDNNSQHFQNTDNKKTLAESRPEDFDRIEVCSIVPKEEATVNLPTSTSTSNNSSRKSRQDSSRGLRVQFLVRYKSIRTAANKPNEQQVVQLAAINSSYKLVCQRDLELNLSLRLQQNHSKDKLRDAYKEAELNAQHFCVFEKEFLRIHEPAWIPINYGSRVQKESLKKFRKAIRMLCVIIIVFVLCWTPYLTFNILQAFGFVRTQLHGFAKHLKTALTLMAYLNSALNPIIYGFMCKSFRENFSRTVARSRHWRCKQEYNIRNENTVKRTNTDRWRSMRSHPKAQPANCGQTPSKPHLDINQPQNRLQMPKQWVSSCGCVHNTWGGEEQRQSISNQVLCGGCGCICGEGHRHFNQKYGNECQLICCNAHGLRVNRSRARKSSFFLHRQTTCGSITI